MAIALLATLVTVVSASSAPLALPDGRVYEMVSPPDKENAEIAVPGNAGGQAQFSVEPQQAASDGEAVTYASFTSFGEAEGAPLVGQYLSQRGPDGWTTKNINPVFEEAFARDPLVGFSPDLSVGAVVSLNPPLAPGAPPTIWNLYRRDNLDGSIETITRGRPEAGDAPSYCVSFGGASHDFDRIAFAAKGSFVEGNPVVAKANNLYEWDQEARDAQQTLTVKATSGEYTLTATAAKGEGTLTTGSAEITGVEVTSPAGAFHVGDEISGTGIAAGTTVDAVGAESLVLSANATASGRQALIATETSSPLSATASAAAVQSALEALPAFDAGNVSVSGGPGDETGSSPYAIAFLAELAGTPVARLKATDAGLAGGAPSSAAVATIEFGGHLRLVSVLPNGEAATPNAQSFFGQLAPLLVSQQCNMERAMVRHAVSADGSRKFWTYNNNTFPGGKKPLFARVLDDSGKAETIQLDAPQGGTGKGEGIFQDASVDGSKVFFTSVQKLTVDSTAAAGNPDLYRYDFDAPVGARLADLTIKPPASPGPAGLLGVIGASAEGDSVYFAARGVLTTTPNSEEDVAVNGQGNLYAWREGEGVRFVAALSTLPPDNGNWAVDLTKQSARVSPNGRYLTFISPQSLTGYDNTLQDGGICQGSLSACNEVFLYDFEADELVCASCNPSGARPLGTASVPSWPSPYEQPRYLLGNGQLFFQTEDALDPHDINELQDVYEFELAGLDGCEAESPNYSEVTGGCLNLISHGDSVDASYFLDASVDGRDIFIATRQRLVPEDVDGSFDVYDARLEGGFPGDEANACEGEACRAAVGAPPSLAPTTSRFEGSGNQVERRRARCRGGKVRRKGRCVARKHQKKKPTARKTRRNSR